MRNIRNKYRKPKVRWNIEEIKADKKLMNKYGLRRKRELLIAREKLRRFRERARELTATKNKEEEKILLEQMVKFGLLETGKHLDDILTLIVDDILKRRLQTVVFNKGLTKTVKAARQHIVHGHVLINGRRMSFPSYLIPAEEEQKINFIGEKK